MIIVDTREKENRHIIDFFKRYKIPYMITKLDYGDYFNTENINVVVERKFSIGEIAHNICSSDHERFIREIERCNAEKLKMYIVITSTIEDLEALEKWNATPTENEKNHTKVKGSTLAKAIRTIQQKYGVEFRFVKKSLVAWAIYNILTTKDKEMYIDKEYLYFDIEKTPKKITGTKFSCLVDKNPYTKKGDQMLEILGILPKEDIDPYYTYRGEITEKLVKELFEKNGNRCVVWDKEKIAFDNFPEQDLFGGLIDIYLPDKDTIIEVKSKSLRKRNDIIVNGSEYEFLQGALYTVLKKAKSLMMCWVFYNEETEQLMKAKQPFDPKGKNHFGEPNVSFYIREWKREDLEGKIETLMQKAREFYMETITTKKIRLCEISRANLIRLQTEGKLRKSDEYE